MVVSIFWCPSSCCTCSIGIPLSIADVARVRRNLCGCTFGICNHYNVWIKRCIDINELATIAYGVELPEDLKASMEALLNA